MQTIYRFTLPKGYIDEDGTVHQQGEMRLATALDEIAPQQDDRVRLNEAYLPILLLARVITQLGTLPTVTPQVVERLFASDLAYLQELYLRINATEPMIVGAVCPHCQQELHVQVAPLS
jgi:hypothetical protein